MKKQLLTLAFGLLVAGTITAQKTYTHVECGTEYTLALRSDSTIWACGENGNYQLGNSAVPKSDTLMPVAPSTKWIFACAGAFHSIGIAADSTMWGWGFNQNGELGLGTVNPNVLPTQVNATMHWRTVSAGLAHTMAIRNDGTLWGTGYNAYGQIGIGDTNTHLSFVQVGTANDWKSVSAGGLFTYAIKNDGSLWVWGYNGDGELGQGFISTQITVPIRLGTENNWTMVSGGFEFGYALKADGTLWSTGFNGNGQLGRHAVGIVDSVLKQVGTSTDWKFIASGASFALAIKQNGSLWGCGFNDYGQLGFHSIASAGLIDSFRLIGTDTNWQSISAADGAIAGSSVFGLHSVGFKGQATELCTTGANYSGQLGNGTIIALPGGQYTFGCTVGETQTAVPPVCNLANIFVYPNPAYDQVTIDGQPTSGTYQLSDISGHQLLNGKLQKGYNSFSVRALPSGIYLLAVHNDEGGITKVKIVKD